MGHVVRDGSRYESDDPHVLADVALATDCVIALIRERCNRPPVCYWIAIGSEELENRREGVSKYS